MNGTSDTRLGVMKEWTSTQSPGEGEGRIASHDNYSVFTSSVLAYIKFSYCLYGLKTKKFL